MTHFGIKWMKPFKIFGVPITLKREKRASLVGAIVKLKGKDTRRGVVTNEKWRGWRLTIAIDGPHSAQRPSSKTKSSSKAPEFVNVWRWKIQR